MGEAAALVTSPSMLSIHMLLSPICFYAPLALPSCCILYFCHAICPRTSFQSGFCHFLFFFPAPCSSMAIPFTQHLPGARCCCPHTHVSPGSLSRLTPSIDCTQIQRCSCSLQRHIQAASGTHSPSAPAARDTRLSRNQSILQGFLKACSL